MDPIYILVTVITALLISKIIIDRNNLRFLQKQNEQDKAHLGALEQERLEYIEKLQYFKNKAELLEKNNEQMELAKKELLEHTKSALFDFSNILSNQLIEIHKKENNESKRTHEENVSKVTQKISNDIQKIIESIAVLNHEVEQSKATVDSVKSALLTPSGAGMLAEVTLENILKASGLKSEVDFIMQYEIKTEVGLKQRPDAIVFLPGGNVMIIDAKASKFLLEMGDDIGKEEDLSQGLLKTMNNHLKTLSLKSYKDGVAESLKSKSKNFGNIITLMFLPTEYVIEKINSFDKAFLQKAWESNILPVGPSGLVNMLCFARFQINDYMRNKNCISILEEAQKLVSSIGLLAEHAKKLGGNIQSIVSSYDKFAASFNKHLLARARAIGKLGIDPMGKKHNYSAMLDRYHLVSSPVEIFPSEQEEDSSNLLVDANQEE